MLGAVQDVGIAWGLTADSLDVVPVTPQWRACQSRTDCHGQVSDTLQFVFKFQASLLHVSSAPILRAEC